MQEVLSSRPLSINLFPVKPNVSDDRVPMNIHTEIDYLYPSFSQTHCLFLLQIIQFEILNRIKHRSICRYHYR